jgi:hypothetical protein
LAEVAGGVAQLLVVRPHFTFMEMQRLVRLQVWMVIVLTIYALLSGYLLYSMPQRAQPILLARSVAEREAQTSDLSQIQSDFRSAVSIAREIQRDRNQLLLICLGATVAVVGFMGWSIFVISRIKREVDHAA